MIVVERLKRALCFAFLLVLTAIPALVLAQQAVPPPRALEEKFARLFAELPPLQYHEADLTTAEVGQTVEARRRYQQILREKLAGRWFAALVSISPGSANQIEGTFPTWKALADFVQAREALVELWAYSENGFDNARRIPATEIAGLRRQDHEQPLFVTLTYLDQPSGKPVKYRVEFGFNAASVAYTEQQAYSQQRSLQALARQILAAHDESGKFSATAQWNALQEEINAGHFAMGELPSKPTDENDLFVAVEYEVNQGNFLQRVVRFWRESDIIPKIVKDGDNYTQVLTLRRTGEKKPLEVRAFRIRGVSDQLEAVPQPLLGQDAVELRVVNPNSPDPREWNVLEFGEPAIVRQVAVAEFSLINAYLDKHRKEIALTRSKLDLFAEPIFAGLNIGCGLAAVPFPVGEAARLGYNVALTPFLIPPVPNRKQMRELMRLVAARETVPGLKTKPARFLDEADFKLLKQRASSISEVDLDRFLDRIQDEDIRAMLRIARMAHLDQEITNLLNITAGAAKVSGWSDEPGLQRDLLNSVYFSVNGEINIKNIIAVLSGHKDATPLSGLSLHDLAHGAEPTIAWLQFFDVTVDVRAVLNTISRLLHSDRANKELKMPFPYATRMSDLAAYEIRIFGYPLFIYYKRGLLKSDYAAFQNDYAYGLITTRIVEHFRTREEMDEEIRAGRMTPLGFVRVPDPKGGWKESNLAVFAHRIPTGKHQGKTAIIIYGLKAYTEQSDLMRREHERLKKFQQALEQGGVIHQLVEAEDRNDLHALDFEPVIYPGTNASAEHFSPLLGNLLEWRRSMRRSVWGLPDSTNETALLERVRNDLDTQGIGSLQPDDDPLLGVDKYNSSFLYRKRVNGHWRTFKMVNIPAPYEVSRELKKAEEGQKIEEWRRQSIGQDGNGIALISAARESEGRYELGPLLRDKDGQVAGAGLITNAAALDTIFQKLGRLPVAERVRLQAHDFASSLVELDTEGTGKPQKVFLTIEFPADKQLERIVTNAISGQPEWQVFNNGRLLRTATARRVTEFDYDSLEFELTSRTYLNGGTLSKPEKGPLLEETKTVDIWHRDLRQANIDPYRPLISKIRANHVTGAVNREEFGLFPQPVITADDLFVVSNRFNSYGLFHSAVVFDNGVNDADFNRPMRDRLFAPISGSPAFELVSTVPATELLLAPDASSHDFKTEVRRTDLRKGLVRTQLFDNAASGRLVREKWTDDFGGGLLIGKESRTEYADEFLFGCLPLRTICRSAASIDLTATTTLAYDAIGRRLFSAERDYTGNWRTNVFDYRWDAPVEIETRARKTTIEFDRAGTSFSGSTVARNGGQQINVSKGTYDTARKNWLVTRVDWFRPGITNGLSTETRTGFGTLLASRSADVFEARPIYDENGREQTNRVFARNSTDNTFNILHRQEDSFEWNAGERTARVSTFIEGKPYDVFRTRTDTEGRIMEDFLRDYPGVSLVTKVTYDGDTARISRTEDFHNEAIRVTREPLVEQQQNTGRWILPVKVSQKWGLVSTQMFVLGDPYGRVLSTTMESGDQVQPREWFGFSAIPRVSELVRPDGRVAERFISILNTGTNNLAPYDLTTKYQLSFWGVPGLTSENSFLRGTDVPLFSDVGNERIFYDPGKIFQAPWYAIDPHGIHGVNATIGGQVHTNVLAVFRARLQEGSTNGASMLLVDKADLRGMFFHRLTQQVFDRSGRLLEESTSRTPISGKNAYLEPAIFDSPRTTLARFKFEYEPGLFLEVTNPDRDGRILVFTNTTLPPGGRGFRVNDGPFPDTITRTDGKVFGSTGESEAARFRDFFVRRVHNVRFLERNPHMPGISEFWSAATRTDLRADGTPLFDLDEIFDAQGRLRVEIAVKTTSSGEPGTRIAYQVTPLEPASFSSRDFAPGLQLLSLDVQGKKDFSGSDFIYLFAIGPTNVQVLIRDEAGHAAKVRSGDPDLSKREISPWQIHPLHVRWLPDDVEPVQGTELLAPAWLVSSGRLIPIAVHDLARAGLDIHRLRTFELAFSNAVPTQVAFSPVYALERGGDFVAERGSREFSYTEFWHSSGLHTILTGDREQTEGDFYSGRRMDALIEFNGMPVATARARGRQAIFPHILWLDNSDPDLSRPLYSLSGRDGRFLEYYQMLRPGDAHLYVAPESFEVPRLEQYRANVLHDELFPGVVGYGRDYRLNIPTSRASGIIGSVQARLRQRIEANAFRVIGERLLEPLLATGAEVEGVRRFNYSRFQEASTRAGQIGQLPTAAQTLVTVRNLPWEGREPASPVPVNVNWTKVRVELSYRHGKDYPATGLIRTSPKTDAERFVDTVKEADLIILAATLGEVTLAGEILDFYSWNSDNGQRPLLAAYDAKSGTAMHADVLWKRAGQSEATAGAQIAMADAAFYLGLQKRNDRWLTFGRNLLHIALTQFRPQNNSTSRGIAEKLVQPVRHALGVTFWPDAEVYSVGSNARAYLLLKKISANNALHLNDPGWRAEVDAALSLQEQFLRTNVVREVERTGVVPAGFFEIQDLEQERTALAVQRWSNSEDWLLFLQAAAEMGIPVETLRQWLDNLARVHGVQVGSIWGLDWRLALLRRDAISPELTARFMALAQRLEHTNAQNFAAQNLNSMRRKDLFPVAITDAPRDRPLTGTRDYDVRPWVNLWAWAPSIMVFTGLKEPNPQPASLPPAPRNTESIPAAAKASQERSTDLTAFILIAAAVYLSILGSALFWWIFRALRRGHGPIPLTGTIVPESVMQRAEERWAKRVLGLQIPANAEHWRYSNTAIEQNFLTQLRTIYKLVLEWRRIENNWDENDPRLAEDANDPWLNGSDEFVVLIGIYMRWVIKAGAKDGFPRQDVLADHEDSNHIWARLTLFFAEHLWSFSAAVGGWKHSRGGPEESDYRDEIQQVLESMGIRQRTFPFDARQFFNAPADPAAVDLLIVQDASKSLTDVMNEIALKLDIPLEHITGLIGRYKEFKQREKPFPIHPYLLEIAKELPHFVLMGLGAIVWYNQRIGDSSIVAYLKSLVTTLALSGESLLWAVPLFGGLLLTVFVHFLRVYRFDAAIRREKAEFFLDASVTSLFVKRHEVEPKSRAGKWRDPNSYERFALALRIFGWGMLARTLFLVETPSFGTFLTVKGLFAMIALFEMAGVLVPLVASWISLWLQDGAARSPLLAAANRLNISATRPASPLWLSIRYHLKPSMPTGTNWGLAQAVVFYFVLAASFFFGAGYLCQQIFPLWFTDTYLHADNGKLFIGGIVFTLTMILMRYGLFLFFTSMASFMAAFPLLSFAGLLGAGHLLVVFFGRFFGLDAARLLPWAWGLAIMALVIGFFERPLSRKLRRWLEDRRTLRQSKNSSPPQTAPRLGIVYMSGDDLSFLKLTPDLLMTRWMILRERLDSRAASLLKELAREPDDATLRSWFQQLYDAEKRAGVTLWHPMQLRVAGQPAAPSLAAPELGLIIDVPDEAIREQMLVAWHLRRWLVCMMSTAGHSQDTAINLVDMALRLEREGLSKDTVFYLIQNKYDSNPNNRPSQTPYDQGELAHRNKLARLLCAVSPGTQAHCIQDWTPFGFKAGGLTGMDLVYEETLRLTTLLLLDRNATVHDLDALMLDLKEAMYDPNLVIVIPGRGTTNTLTPLGQASQLVEEGHRSFLRGLMSLLGGTASECVGTGWGNLLACFYGRVQRALLLPRGRRMPLTSRMKRGTTFADSTEGLIGFGPHAVGISEDIWAVVQGMNTALGLGYRPRFALSRAIWHKIRETWSHGEWLASFPRWAGGYFQMAHDPLMQRIYDFGPQPVFTREIRSNSGRNFLAAPIALASILLMPLAIIFDVSPFVQTLVILWNCGFVLNQVLTLHALNTYLESSGFYRSTAIIGALFAALGTALLPKGHLFGPALVLGGFLTGGFFVGLSRWIATRVRDLIVFGPQLVLQTLSQTVRMSLEFTVSGTSAEDAKRVNMSFRTWAGPREDRPLDVFPNFINLRTVIWIFGLGSMVLCLFALANLDMLNVLLLLPSLLFSVSTIAGPFLVSPAQGKPLGPWIVLPRMLAWASALVFYTLVSLSISRGKWGGWVGLVLFLVVFGAVIGLALRYVRFRAKLLRGKRALIDLIKTLDPNEERASRVAGHFVQVCASDPAKLPAELQRRGVPPDRQDAIVALANKRLVPILRKPVYDLDHGLFATNRWALEWGRSFVLALFILLWFFLVPVPGLTVFTAGSQPERYRFTLVLGNIVTTLGWAVVLALIASWVGTFIQWLNFGSAPNRGLRQRLQSCFARLKQLPPTLSPADTSSAFALLTDSQTYLDQSSYAYARRSIDLAERTLISIEARKQN